MYFNYWVVRYVPNVIRGEFVNVGLIVGSDEHGWAFRRVMSLRRASRLGGDPTVAAYWLGKFQDLVDGWGQRLDDSTRLWTPDSGKDAVSEALLARLGARLNNAVQLSAPQRVVAASAEDGVNLLFDALVADPEPVQRDVFRQRISTKIERSFQEALADVGNWSLVRRPSLVLGKNRQRTDLALTDSQVEQLTMACSFNLRDRDGVQRDIRGWAYFMEHIRERGARLQTMAGTDYEVPNDVQLRVVYEEPKTAERHEDLEAAFEIWNRIDGLKCYTAAQATQLVKDGVALVA